MERGEEGRKGWKEGGGRVRKVVRGEVEGGRKDRGRSKAYIGGIRAKRRG